MNAIEKNKQTKNPCLHKYINTFAVKISVLHEISLVLFLLSFISFTYIKSARGNKINIVIY